MKTAFIAALFCAASLVEPGAHAQQSGEDRKQFLEYKVKAEEGNAEAQNNLGLCYAKGTGVEKDYAEAVSWYRKAAAQGYAKAQFNLGGRYYSGQGVEKDYGEALKWFRKATDQNLAEAQYALGTCYYEGQGVDKDFAEAVNWYRKAGEQNYDLAQFRLGMCYAFGEGVEKDHVEAYAWFNLSAKTYKVSVAAREKLEENLSTQQVADAQKRTKELRLQIEAKLKSGGK